MGALFVFKDWYGDIMSALNVPDCKNLLYAVCMYGALGVAVPLDARLQDRFKRIKADIDEQQGSGELDG